MKLPYALDALEPHLSAETLEFHHGRHHRKYVDKLNDLIEGTEYADMPLERIVSTAGAGDVFNNAAQVWNHDLYWRGMSPDGGGRPEGQLAHAIDSSYGSFEDFRTEFTDAVTGLFGSGWVWLVKTGADIVSIAATKDAVNPLVHGRTALLACDVWEHAYYIDYRNERGRYLDAWWQLVDWDFAASRLVT
jgi:Fe-Mn family superoxide dismutase